MASSVGSNNSPQTVQELLDQNSIYLMSKEKFDKRIGEDHRAKTITTSDITAGYVLQGAIEVAKRVALFATISFIAISSSMSLGTIGTIVASGVVSSCLGNDELRSKFSQLKSKAELLACFPTRIKIISIVAQILPEVLLVTMVKTLTAYRFTGWLATGLTGFGLFIASQLLMDDIVHTALYGVERWHERRLQAIANAT